jgi:hypothetical protein
MLLLITVFEKKQLYFGTENLALLDNNFLIDKIRFEGASITPVNLVSMDGLF